MLTDDQLAGRIGPRLRRDVRELADITAPDDLPARLRRRHASHTRRSVAASAAAAATAAGVAALAVAASGPAAQAPTKATLTAWTVKKQPDGTVKIIVRLERDLAGLQLRLRQAGIPANVTLGKLSPECHDAPSFSSAVELGGGVTVPLKAHPHEALVISVPSFTIRPARIPRGEGVALNIWPLAVSSGAGGKLLAASMRLRYVRASKQCTG
jgi:hypothetical protein